MGKRRVPVFSLSWPVHWIIHTKCFLLKKEQGREGVAQSGYSLEMPLAGASGTAVGKGGPGGDRGMVAARCVRKFILISPSVQPAFAPKNQSMSLIKISFFPDFPTPGALNY